MFADPQLTSHRMTINVEGPQGPRTLIRQPVLFDGVGAGVSGPLPRLGQHNANLLERRPAIVTSG